MTSELIERVAGAISETRTGNSLSWRHYVAEAQAAIAAMQADAAPVAWQRRLKYPQAPGAIPQWEECSLNEAVGHFEKQPGYEYRPLYAHPPVADREAVRADQAAEIAALKSAWEAQHKEKVAERAEAKLWFAQAQEAKTELAKWKALAETLAGELQQIEVDAMEYYNEWCETGCDQKDAIRFAFGLGEETRKALRQYKEARDAS